MRKAVVLITGAGGEIGHALVRGLADSDTEHHHARRQSARREAGAATCAASSPARLPTRDLLDRILAEFEVDCVFHLAALLSTRAEFTPVTAHHVNVEGHAQSARVRPEAGRIARPAGRLRLPVVNRDLRASGPRDEDARRAACTRTSIRIRRRCTGATSCIARSWAATTRATTSSCRWTSSPRVDFRCVRFPGPDLGDDDAVRRHVRFRARDDPCGGERGALRLLRAARHDDSVHGHARRVQRAAPARRRRRASD